MVRDILPDDVKCSSETRDLLVQCCIEFIHLLASEANDICSTDSKKTIGADHILKALQVLGFSDYASAVTQVYDQHREHVQEKTKWSKKLENSGKTEEQLREEQQALFRQAKEACRTDTSRLQKKRKSESTPQNTLFSAPTPSDSTLPKALLDPSLFKFDIAPSFATMKSEGEVVDPALKRKADSDDEDYDA
eukprot:TRINITY_DN5828_c0_g1_i3.p1 TRINITY_DN5828_c0_g1~~TRINITY_DN5828_c0_g1_i3.p1  ORF type:complete len:219 (+),score=66.87 TRINITY_DN5828_c0_g1_i3:83-658(+)